MGRTVLFLNAGRRVELLEAFRRELRKEGADGRIVATDVQTNAPAWHMADMRAVLPHSSSHDFINKLKQLCRNARVDLIVPLIDPDLPILAASRAMIEEIGTRVLISSPEAIAVCRDKALTGKFLLARGLPGIASLAPNEARQAALPLIVKPRNGSASINVFEARTPSELDFFLGYIPDPIVQPRFVGAEFTVDVFCHPQDGRTLSAVPRRRLKVRGGEVSVGQIVRDEPLEKLAAQVAESVGISGPANIQVIVAQDGPHVLEINPRFGGGCPLSIAGGAPFVGWCLDIAAGRPLRGGKITLEAGLTMMRYDSSLFVSAEGSPIDSAGMTVPA